MLLQIEINSSVQFQIQLFSGAFIRNLSSRNLKMYRSNGLCVQRFDRRNCLILFIGDFGVLTKPFLALS
jgi:hypothetical protein